MIAVNVFAVTVRAFHPAMLGRDLQPNTRVPQGPFATVAGDAVLIDNLGLWGGQGHGGSYRQFAVVMGQKYRILQGPSSPVDPYLIAVISGTADMDIGDFGVFKNGLGLSRDVGVGRDDASAIDDPVRGIITL